MRNTISELRYRLYETNDATPINPAEQHTPSYSMPRILNAKQTDAKAAKKPNPVIPGKPYTLVNVASGKELGTASNGTLTTNNGRLEVWIFTPVFGKPLGSFYVWAAGRAEYVVDGHRPDPVRTGPSSETRVVVFTAGAGDEDNTIALKAPDSELVWTLVEDHVEYLPNTGEATQLWRLTQ